MFGDPGSAACAIAANDQGTTPAPGVHCLLSGPQANQTDLLSALPRGVATGQELVVKPGTVVLQATDPNPGHHTSFAGPNTQFYVLRDRGWLVGDQITNPKQSTDQSGSPDLAFSFTPTGAHAFQTGTAAIAHRGTQASGLGQTLNQHFAVALDHKLLTVPQIDFKTYPDGISGRDGADIAGGLTTQSARDLATVLAVGSLSVNLEPVQTSSSGQP
jgi:preprotein translocase subunit SecD